MYYVGCDQHKHYTVVTAKDKEGNLMSHERLHHSDRERLTNYFSSLPEGSKVLLEACGFEPWLCDLLQEMNLNVKLAHPLKTKAIAEEKIMTDKISSSVLADLLRANLVCEAYIASPQIRMKRYRMRYRQSLTHLRTVAKNKTHSLIDRLGIQTPEITDLFGKAGRSYLENLKLEPTYQRALTGYLSLIDLLTKMVKELDKESQSEAKNDPRIQLLMTIPGIGITIAHLAMAEIGDINRFRSSAKLASYTGIIPSLHQSGKVSYSGHITKQGNKYLRWAFVEAAQVAIRHDPYLKNVYEKLRHKKGNHIAIVAVAHRLLIYTYQVLKTNTPYRYKVAFFGRS